MEHELFITVFFYKYFREFLEQRKIQIEEQNKEIEEAKAAKMMRL